MQLINNGIAAGNAAIAAANVAGVEPQAKSDTTTESIAFTKALSGKFVLATNKKSDA